MSWWNRHPTAPAAPQPKGAPRAWNWTVYATIVAPVIIAGILVWQLFQLDPKRWCVVSADAGNAATCYSLLSDMLAIYKQNTLALIVILGISLVTIVVTTLKARVDVEGFGMHAKINDAPTPVEVVNTAESPVPTAPQPGEQP